MDVKLDKSCKMHKNCTEFTTEEKCNPKCDFYNPIDGSTPEKVDEAAEKKLKNEIIITQSDLEKFDKLHEFIILKKHVFAIQNVSPKKIILKFKRKLQKTDKLPNGVYVFKDQNGQLLEPIKEFKKLDARAKTKKATIKKAKNNAI